VRGSLGSLSETAATVLALLLTIAIMTGFALVLDLLFTISIAQ
jgi:preprotein translocase subunit SecE